MSFLVGYIPLQIHVPNLQLIGHLFRKQQIEA